MFHRRFFRITVETWRSIATRWLLPIVLVGGPLLWAQMGSYSPDLAAIIQGAGVSLAILLIAPLTWRLLFPVGLRPRHHPLRALAYLVIAVAFVWGSSGMAGVKYALFSGDPGPFFALGLFLVTGFGLGRDVQMEVTLARERQRAEALAREAEQAELRAVRSHLDPHFLFNTLNAIAEWCREDPAVAEEALVRLSALLHTILPATRSSTWPMARELELVEGLAELYRVRDPERFQLERVGWELCPDAQLPPMLLLSLVENAFKHGPAAGEEGAVSVELAPGRMSVSNPGEFTGPRTGGEGLALAERRVALTWPAGGEFSIGSVDGVTTATIVYPVEAA